MNFDSATSIMCFIAVGLGIMANDYAFALMSFGSGVAYFRLSRHEV